MIYLDLGKKSKISKVNFFRFGRKMCHTLSQLQFQVLKVSRDTHFEKFWNNDILIVVLNIGQGFVVLIWREVNLGNVCPFLRLNYKISTWYLANSHLGHDLPVVWMILLQLNAAISFFKTVVLFLL